MKEALRRHTSDNVTAVVVSFPRDISSPVQSQSNDRPSALPRMPPATMTALGARRRRGSLSNLSVNPLHALPLSRTAVTLTPRFAGAPPPQLSHTGSWRNLHSSLPAPLQLSSLGLGSPLGLESSRSERTGLSSHYAYAHSSVPSSSDSMNSPTFGPLPPAALPLGSGVGSLTSLEVSHISAHPAMPATVATVGDSLEAPLTAERGDSRDSEESSQSAFTFADRNGGPPPRRFLARSGLENLIKALSHVGTKDERKT